MVGIIVSRAVGEPLADYLSRKIWAPYGMESDASCLPDGGTEIGGCCLNVTLRDYGRLGLFRIAARTAGGQGLVTAGWICAPTPCTNAHGEPPPLIHCGLPSTPLSADTALFDSNITTPPLPNDFHLQTTP